MYTRKICFYSPYLPKHFGGGEKYLLDCARVAAQERLQVFVAVQGQHTKADLEKSKQKYEDFLGVTLSRVTFISTPLGTSQNWLFKLFWTSQWDVLYYLTDGSLFFSMASKNLLHIQIPFSANTNKGFLNKVKLLNWGVKNANSRFTQQIVSKNWQTRINYVHYPMIEYQGRATVTEIPKEKVILHIGRFFRQLHSKRQDVLVTIFKKLRELYPLETKEWKLVLIGSVEDTVYAEEVHQLAKGLPIEIYHDATHDLLWQFLDKASIYWHATGYGHSELDHPEKMEHFGISTVEALAAGCVPIVINKGGQTEILTGELSRLLWSTQQECINLTKQVISDNKFFRRFSRLARERAKNFGQSEFRKTLMEMISR